MRELTERKIENKKEVAQVGAGRRGYIYAGGVEYLVVYLHAVAPGCTLYLDGYPSFDLPSKKRQFGNVDRSCVGFVLDNATDDTIWYIYTFYI